MYKILIVEDDVVMAYGLVMALEKEGYIVQPCHTLKKAGELLKSSSYDMLVLDVNLPDGDGASFCKEYKKNHSVPVLMLTAYNTNKDEERGLGEGVEHEIRREN